MAGRTGRELARARSDVMDEAVLLLCGDLGSDVAVAAVGGYGRRQLAPGSDVDLMVLHGPGGDGPATQIVDAVLYPMWDSGLAVSHSVRTPDDCMVEAAARLESLTALLDARPLVGSAGLVSQAREAASSVAGDDPDAFIEALRESRAERKVRFGSVGRMLEPDLREGLGGLRDVQILGWLSGVTPAGHAGQIGIEKADRLADALDHLLLVRTALHRVTGSRSNRLLAEHHHAVAKALGLDDRPGWEARDWLMRGVFGHGRWIEHVADLALGAGGGDQTLTSRGVDDLMRTLEGPDAPAVLAACNSVGRIDRWLPEWEAVRGRPQRDPYHRYPVDVHLIETLNEAGRLVREPDEAFVTEAARTIGDPAPLFLGALFHDIGKDGHGSHVPRGVEVAGEALDRMGVKSDLRDDVLFQVAEHLLLANTATRRNLDDEDLILHVAATIGDERRLALLYLLTVADAHATGPTASSPWRLGLIRQLVAKVSHAFESGLMDPDRAGRLTRADARIREELGGAGVADEEAEAFLEAVPAGYVMWVRPEETPDHLALVSPTPGPAEVRATVRAGATRGTYRVSLGAVDRLGLLAAVAGSMTLSGLTILSAHAFTTEDGLALDVFDVRGAFEEEVSDERWERFRTSLGQVLRGSLDLRERVHALRAHYRATPDDIPVTVRIDRDASDFFTVVEVSAPDRLGLLFDLASTISEHDLDVHVAKVATYGERVIDVFYVRDAAGQKVEDLGRASALERSLAAAASPR